MWIRSRWVWEVYKEGCNMRIGIIGTSGRVEIRVLEEAKKRHQKQTHSGPEYWSALDWSGKPTKVWSLGNRYNSARVLTIKSCWRSRNEKRARSWLFYWQEKIALPYKPVLKNWRNVLDFGSLRYFEMSIQTMLPNYQTLQPCRIMAQQRLLHSSLLFQGMRDQWTP